MKTLWHQDELAEMECNLGHTFSVDATTEENLSVDRRVGLYAVCPECGEDELTVRVIKLADSWGVSITSLNEAVNFAVEHNIPYNARKELALLLEKTWLDGRRCAQFRADMERL